MGSKGAKRILPWLFPATVIAVYLALYFIAPERTLNSLGSGGKVLLQAALPLILAFVMMFLLNLFITPAHVSRFMGAGSGLKGILLSSAAGIISMGPVYAWYPLLKTLKEKGASDFHLANFLSNRAVKPVLIPMLVIYLGWRFTLVFTLLSILGALMVAVIVDFPGTHRHKTLQMSDKDVC